MIPAAIGGALERTGGPIPATGGRHTGRGAGFLLPDEGQPYKAA
ncbi:hypothetical protein [Streptomyces sp. NPDC003393]